MAHIGPAVSIVGDVECDDDDLLVESAVRGRVGGRDVNVTIGGRARIQGDVRGRRVIVHGHIYGSVWASERIELAPSAVVHGSLSADIVVVPEGAIVNGRIDMGQRTIAAAVARYKAERAGLPA